MEMIRPDSTDLIQSEVIGEADRQIDIDMILPDKPPVSAEIICLLENWIN